jgi:malate dehydrogenase
MVPDFENALIDGKPLTSVITDRKWLETDFFTTVQKRGAAIIDARGKSSAASAASAAIDHVKRLSTPTKKGEFFSAAVPSNGKHYGIPAGLMFSLPLRSNGTDWEVVEGIKLSSFAQAKVKLTTDELLQEREVVKDLLG